ncbi:MAG: hypothetical protein ACOCWG_01905, partial [bacterium]
GIIGFNLNYSLRSKTSNREYSLKMIKLTNIAIAECTGGGIEGYDEEDFLCSCGLWTTGCLSMINHCCLNDDDCEEICKDPEV